MTGRIVLIRDIEFPGSYPLDLSDLYDGLYFLTLQNNAEQMIEKVLLKK